jgi:AmiR/NasT family two-component response regulator
VQPIPHEELRELLAEVAAHRAEVTKELNAAHRYIAHLQTALITNRTIAMAVGIVMARRGLTEDVAFEILRSRSQRENRKVRDLADEIVYTGDLPEAATG